MKIQESAENYLEAILILKQNKGSVRSIDIAHYLNFSKPSVSIAMKNLRNSELITVDSDGFISLTDVISPESFRAIKDHLNSQAHIDALSSQDK